MHPCTPYFPISISPLIKGKKKHEQRREGAMAVSIQLTKEYGYVVLVLVAYAFLNFWMSFQVGKARRK
jgi:hypothetical protein